MTWAGFYRCNGPMLGASAAVILISVLFWIPMVGNITRPLGRMTRATEEIAKGRFDVPIHERRNDEIVSRKKKHQVQIEVRDQGRGVAEELLHQLFEPFFRPEAVRGRDTGGVGLGMAIVKTCVETCRGTVSAANVLPKGFAVTITLRSGNRKERA